MPRILPLLCILLVCRLDAAEYQWSAEMPSKVSVETKGHPRAFLWIPSSCERVRGVVLAQHNMLEIPVFESPLFRQTMAELNFAIVWITPPWGGATSLDAAGASELLTVLDTLADKSGYAELASAPVVPMGHSAMAEFPYLFAAALPQRTLAAISLKGSWPEKQPWIEGFAASGVPLLFISGEYEWAEERAGKAQAFRRKYPSAPLSMLADAGGGHFDHHGPIIRFMADYIRAAALHPERPLDATKQGVLMDRWRMNQPPRSHSSDTFWCFDENQARATERLQKAFSGKQPQLLGCKQNGHVVEQVNGTHQQVTLQWLPDPQGDGRTFTLEGAFLDSVPAGRPERWTKLKAGSAISHPNSAEKIAITPICGPVEKLSSNSFTLKFDRLGFDNAMRSSEIWLQIEHPGDDHYKRAVQQALLRIPLRNTEGQQQTIEFDRIAADLKLHARSSSGEKVRFYVREGPAEIVDDTLRLTPVPPRAKKPVEITVVAWQWGRSMEPKLQTAEPVSRTFVIQP